MGLGFRPFRAYTSVIRCSQGVALCFSLCPFRAHARRELLTANSIYKELKGKPYMLKVPFSVKRADELNQNMYQISIILPESKKTKNILLKMDHE
jgi:hypothetical protein